MLKSGISIVIRSKGVVDFEPQPAPENSAGEILLRRRKTLISPGSELALFTGTHSGLADPEVLFAKYPFHPGYSAVSEVVRIGPDAEASGVRIGDRILHLGCHCSWTVLDPFKEIWVRIDPAWDETSVLFARFAQIAATAVCRVRVRPSTALVLGAGLIGIFAAQQFRLNGSETVAIQDLSRYRLAMATRCGVTKGISSEKEHNSVFGKMGIDCVIEATGVASRIPMALTWVREGGDVILLGSPRGLSDIDFYKLVHRKSAALIGAHECGIPARAKDGSISRQRLLEENVEKIVTGRLRLDGLLSKEIEPTEIADVYNAMASSADRYLGVALNWH